MPQTPQPPGIQLPDLTWGPVLPEIVLVGAAVLILMVDAFRSGKSTRPLLVLSLLALAATAAVTVPLWRWEGEPTVLSGMVSADRFAVFFRLVLLASAALGLLLADTYLRRSDEERGEYYPLLLFATAGMTLLVSAADLIVVFLAIEVLSLSLYVLVGFSRRRLGSQEASLKYFLLGAFSSAFLLYGIAFMYGATGTTSLAGIARALTGETGPDLALALVGAGLLSVGFAFKVAAVPFHMWTPDVYQGAPTPVTAFMAAGTKVAGFAALLRVATVALGSLGWDIRPALWVLAALSMVVGSLLAISQTDIKRMLAYSSVGHAGFVLVGVVAANQEGIAGAMFYLATYVAMIIGAFAVVMLVSRRGEERTSLDAYAGLARSSPWLGGLLALFLLSLAGIPPTAGFMAKILVFQAAVQAGQWELVVVAVLASVIAAFFYLRVIVLMYMREPADAPVPAPAFGPGLALVVAAAVTIALGIFPGLLLDVLGPAAVLRW